MKNTAAHGAAHDIPTPVNKHPPLPSSLKKTCNTNRLRALCSAMGYPVCAGFVFVKQWHFHRHQEKKDIVMRTYIKQLGGVRADYSFFFRDCLDFSHCVFEYTETLFKEVCNEK
jgi:hypothetical protein